MGAGAAPALAALGAFAATAVGKVLTTILINVALNAVVKYLTKKPRQNVPPINVTVRNTIENRRILFGTVRAGGAFVFYDVSGVNKDFLWYVIVLSGHQVTDIRDVWVDTVKIADSAINGGSSAGGEVTSGQFNGRMWIYKHLGTGSQTVDTELDGDFAAWTSNHRLRGCAYLAIVMQRDDEAYPNGAPQHITALTDGAALYDPRLDSTNGGSGSHRRDDPQTWGTTDAIRRNPALQWRWYVSGGSVHNDSASRLIKYGLRESDSRILDSYVATAANKCDESVSGGSAPPSGAQSRYKSDLEVSVGEPRRDVLNDILATMAGTHVVVHGQHRVYAGAYDAPTHSFTEQDLYGQLECEDTVDHHKRYNAVAGVYRDATKEYVEQTTPFRTSSTYETQDGGKQIPIEIDLRGVSDPYQAQRLCEIKLRRSRMMRTVKLVGALNLLKVAVHETLNYSHARYGWSSRVFRCIEKQLDFNEEAGKVVLTCQQEASTVYADMATGDYVTSSSYSSSSANETPDTPTGLTTLSLNDGIQFTWAPPAFGGASKFYNLYEYTAASPSSSATLIVSSIVGTTRFVTKADTTVRYYWITALDPVTGAESSKSPSGNGVAGSALGVTTGFRATVSPSSASVELDFASSGDTNTVTVTPVNGTPTYSYSWTRTSGSTDLTVNSSTAATTSFHVVNMNNLDVKNATFKCTVTDSSSPLKTFDVFVQVSAGRNDSY